MVVTRKLATNSFQERLSKDDIRLVLEALRIAREDGSIYAVASHTRVELLIGKLHRMEKQK